MDKNLQASAEKLLRIQKQAKEDFKLMQSHIDELKSWESEMKRKEAALQGAYEQDILPPVRSKKQKLIKARQSKPETRISSSDYASWEKFDVDKACEQVDMAEVGPPSLDSKKSLPEKKAKLIEEAIFEKERGNNFVKKEKWDEAIKCYSRAIEIDNRDAIFYANRALCYLKIDKLHDAESDCSQALSLDPTYVKALLRRATAREKLGSLKAAANDLTKVVEYEPHNAAARKQLHSLKARMGSKGGNKKTSPQTSPTTESRAKLQNKMAVDDNKTEIKEPKDKTPIERWMDGTDEGITVIKPVKKPPHLRSKRTLKPVIIKEIPLGKTSPEKPPTRIQIKEVDDLSHGDSNNNGKSSENKPLDEKSVKPEDKGDMPLSNGIQGKAETESKIVEVIMEKDNENKDLKSEEIVEVVAEKVNEKKDIKPDIITNDNKMNGETVKESKIDNEKSIANDKKLRFNEKLSTNDEKPDLVAPANSVQFMLEWRSLRDVNGGRSHYLSLIDPEKIPAIFDNALESDILSSVLNTLSEETEEFRNKTADYLQGLAKTKRFSALAMFLSPKDKHLVNNLLVQCQEKEGCSDDVINDLKNKFEL